MPSTRALRPAVWLLPAIALAVRLATVWILGEDGRLMGDSQDYLDAARALASGAPYPESSGLPFWRPPGYPSAIAAVWALLPGSVIAVLVVQCVLDVGGMLLLGSMVRRAAGGGAAMVAQAWYAVYPPFLLHAATVQTETWFQVGLLGAAALLVPPGRGAPGRGRVAGAGLVLGAITLVRPVGLLLVPLLIAWLALLRAGSAPVQREVLRWAADGAILVVAFLVPILPWSSRVEARHGTRVLVNEAGWFNIWYTTTPAAQRAVWDPAGAQPALDSLLTLEIPSMAGGWPPHTLAERKAFWKEQALAGIARDPWAFARYRLHGVWHTWRPWLTPGFYSPRAVAGSIALFLPWLVLGTLGLVETWRRHPGARPLVGLVVSFALVATASNLIGTPVIRYRIPLVDPYFVGMAGAWLAPRLVRNPWWRRWAPPEPPPSPSEAP
ncbi:MAG TPA: hypothetical protein VLH75_18815 [Longimicrobiales bacterium]|nr:hypothetical protein [Longimicrobiales bacterium]